MIVIAKCRMGCQVNLRLPERIMVTFWGERKAQEMRSELAIPYLVWCASHHYPMSGSKLKARYSKAPCNAKCLSAESTDCSCQCGGINHGMGVK